MFVYDTDSEEDNRNSIDIKEHELLEILNPLYVI